MSEFVEVEWFGREDTIGIVLTYDEFDGFNARMAPVRKGYYMVDLLIDGTAIYEEERQDVDWLMSHAAKIPFEWAWGIFRHRMETGPIVRYDHRDYDIKTLVEVKK